MLKFLVIIIVLILINLYQSYRIFNGNWQTIEEFNDSGTTVFINFNNTEVRVIFVSGNKTVIHDGHMYFYTYDIRSLFLFDSCGYIKTDFKENIFPKYLYYKYSPTGHLKIFKDKNYGEFIKIND